MQKSNFLVVIILLFFSCSNDNDDNIDFEPIDDFMIESYHGYYLSYDVPLFPHQDSDNLIKFEYDELGRIIKRKGNLMYTALGAYLTDSLYTDLTYENNKVHLIKGISYFDFTIPNNETIITLDSQNRISKKIQIQEVNGAGQEIDTTNFNYSNGKLVSYVKTSNKEYSSSGIYLRKFEESTLYYTYNNLDSIVTVFSEKWSDYNYVEILKKETQKFNGYDSSENPFRKLHIFDESFTRSISENNFTDYIKSKSIYNYPIDNNYDTGYFEPAQDIQFKSWTFSYDENGQWLYDEF